MINIAAVLLMISFPLSVIGVDFNHHICTTKHVHLVSPFGSADCGGHNAPDVWVIPSIKFTKVQKEKPVPSCCQKEAAPTVNKVSGEKAKLSVKEKKADCCSHEQQKPGNGPRFEKENCCKNYVERISVGNSFCPAATDNTVQNNRIECEVPVSALARTEAVELFKFARQKIPKPDYRLITEHIVSFIHYSSCGS